ncbi:MAG: hypothetical protein LBS43_03300 [Prevotellaceae bacterium]|jgi:hypothetical protein|nr:hypothetical protein [Prevotellaceae bacterium]
MGIFDFLKKKENTGADEDEVYLQAVPITRKRMDLLWLDPPKLGQVQQLVAQYGVVTVTMGDNSNLRDHKITQEDITWADIPIWGKKRKLLPISNGQPRSVPVIPVYVTL